MCFLNNPYICDMLYKGPACLLCCLFMHFLYIVLLMLVGRYVGRLVEQMVSADYLKYYLSQSLHISHVDWS